jgi:hypothetical protein
VSELVDNVRAARLIGEPGVGIVVEYQLYGHGAVANPFVTIDWATVQAVIKDLDAENNDLLKTCKLAVTALNDLAEQQAMPDDSWRADVAKIEAAIAKAEAAGEEVNP